MALSLGAVMHPLPLCCWSGCVNGGWSCDKTLSDLPTAKWRNLSRSIHRGQEIYYTLFKTTMPCSELQGGRAPEDSEEHRGMWGAQSYLGDWETRILFFSHPTDSARTYWYSISVTSLLIWQLCVASYAWVTVSHCAARTIWHFRYHSGYPRSKESRELKGRLK